MKIAYFIGAYKLPDQMVRLVRKLESDTSIFLIHIDKKTDAATFRRMWEPLRHHPSVHFLKRHPVYWGDSGVLRASLKAIKELVDSHVEYDYLIYLTSQDYPIKSNDQIGDALQKAHGRSFMQYFPLPDRRWREENGGLDRVAYRYYHWYGRWFVIRRNGKLMKMLSAGLGTRLAAALPIERPMPGNLTPYGGSALWCLSRACAEYVHGFLKQDRRILPFFNSVLIPDEIFYQTILLNSPLQPTVVDDEVHYIAWPELSGPHPDILGLPDFDRFMATDKLFARKFDATVDSKVLDRIDAETC